MKMKVLKKYKPNRNVKTKKPYNGEQEQMLEQLRISRGWESNEWGSFLCWKGLDRKIIKGEKSVLCFYPSVQVIDDVDGTQKIKKSRMWFRLFNKNQTTNK